MSPTCSKEPNNSPNITFIFERKERAVAPKQPTSGLLAELCISYKCIAEFCGKICKCVIALNFSQQSATFT